MKYVWLGRPPLEQDGKKVLVGGDEVTTAWFISWLINNDLTFNGNGEGIRVSIKIDAALTTAREKKSEWLPLEDAHHKLLEKTADNPNTVVRGPCYPVGPARALSPIIEDIKGAKGELPED